MKATEHYCPFGLVIMLYKVVLTFESADEILKREHSTESYWAVLSCVTVYYTVQKCDFIYIYPYVSTTINHIMQ